MRANKTKSGSSNPDENQPNQEWFQHPRWNQPNQEWFYAKPKPAHLTLNARETQYRAMTHTLPTITVEGSTVTTMYITSNTLAAPMYLCINHKCRKEKRKESMYMYLHVHVPAHAHNYSTSQKSLQLCTIIRICAHSHNLWLSCKDFWDVLYVHVHVYTCTCTHSERQTTCIWSLLISSNLIHVHVHV